MDAGTIESYTIRLAYDGCHANVNGKIWSIWSTEVNVSIIADEKQEVLCKLIKKKAMNFSG